MMRRIPGQPLYRAAPNGRDDTPTAIELDALEAYLRITVRRLRGLQ